MHGWLEMHCWKSVPLAIATFFGVLYGISCFAAQPPLHSGLAYIAMRDYLQRSEVIDRNADLNFASSHMVERNGEAIVSGTGSARSLHADKFELPVFEQVDMEFIAIVTRSCLGQTASCYSVQEMTLTKEANIWPRI